MKNPFEAKPLNKWQQSRAPQQQVSDSAFADLRQELADQKIFNKHATYANEVTDPKTGIKTKIYFDRKSDVWRAEFTFSDGSTQTVEADSRDELILAVASERAHTLAENQEAEREANPTFQSQRHRTEYEWLIYGKWGRRFAEWVEYLPQQTVNEIFAVIRQKASRMYGKGAQIDPRCIEWAFVELLDEGRLDAFENEAAKIRKQCEAESVKNAEQERVTAERLTAEQDAYDHAMADYEREEAEKRGSEEKKLSKTKKGLAELRRRALFGDKENAFPVSTGTAKRN